MAKKFAEHNGLNLTETNKVVLDSWNKNNVFQKSITEREGCPQFVFFEVPLRQTDIRVYIMSLHVR